jgi:GNAT superfamily N-acetyltransferase
VRISKSESKFFELAVGRYSGNLPSLDMHQLEKDIIQVGVDVCRIKVLGSDIKLFEKLRASNYHYDIYNLNYSNKLNFTDLKTIEPLPELHVREVTNPDADDDFISVLGNILESRSWVEYDTFLSQNFLTEAKKQEASYEFYSSFSKANDGNSYTGLMYYNDIPVGLFMGLFKGEVFFGNLFGLVEKYRGKGFAKYFYGFMCDICKARGIKYFENEVNIFNFSSQKSAISQNFLPKDIYYNLTLYPFCNIASHSFKNLKVFTFAALINYLAQTYKNYEIMTIKRKQYLPKKEHEGALISEAIHTDLRIFLVVHFMTGKNIAETVYIDLEKS